MSLSGTFATMPFPDLLQWIGEARRSGSLTVTLEFEERYLTIVEGAVTLLGTDDARGGDLSRLLLARGLVDEPAVTRITNERLRSRRPMAEIAVAGGFIARETLAAAVRAHAKDVVLQLFLWHDARFLFVPIGAPPLVAEPREDLALTPPLPTRELLFDGMRKIDEWRRIAEVLPSDYTLVHALGRAPELPALEALADAGEPLAIGDLCLRVPRPRFDILDELYTAWRRGLVAIDATPRELARPTTLTPVASLIATARTLLDEQQFDEAAVLLRSALDLDPYADDARVLLHRARDEQLAALYVQFPPHRVPVLARPGADVPPRERYLLARVDGQRDVATLTVVTPLGELETLRALKRLHHAGVIALRP